LRRNNSAQRVTPGQHNAAMVHFSGWLAAWAVNRLAGSLHQSSSAGGAPVGGIPLFHHRVALAANPFHAFKNTGMA
jgi:hypothetical protein